MRPQPPAPDDAAQVEVAAVNAFAQLENAGALRTIRQRHALPPAWQPFDHAVVKPTEVDAVPDWSVLHDHDHARGDLALGPERLVLLRERIGAPAAGVILHDFVPWFTLLLPRLFHFFE